MDEHKATTSSAVSLSQDVSKGNTSKTRHPSLRNRTRTWCFTLNNYTEEDLVSLSHNKWGQIEINKFAFQEEIGEEKKTPHLQGVVQFKNQVSFTTLKEFHDKISWRKTKNLRASVKYCTKVQTRKEGAKPHTYNIPDKWVWKDLRTHHIPSHELLALMKDEMMKDRITGLDKLELVIGEIGNGGRWDPHIGRADSP